MKQAIAHLPHPLELEDLQRATASQVGKSVRTLALEIMPFPRYEKPPVHWDCPACGWVDNLA